MCLAVVKYTHLRGLYIDYSLANVQHRNRQRQNRNQIDVRYIQVVNIYGQFCQFEFICNCVFTSVFDSCRAYSFAWFAQRLFVGKYAYAAGQQGQKKELHRLAIYSSCEYIRAMLATVIHLQLCFCT